MQRDPGRFVNVIGGTTVTAIVRVVVQNPAEAFKVYMVEAVGLMTTLVFVEEGDTHVKVALEEFDEAESVALCPGVRQVNADEFVILALKGGVILAVVVS